MAKLRNKRIALHPLEINNKALIFLITQPYETEELYTLKPSIKKTLISYSDIRWI